MTPTDPLAAFEEAVERVLAGRLVTRGARQQLLDAVAAVRDHPSATKEDHP